MAAVCFLAVHCSQAYFSCWLTTWPLSDQTVLCVCSSRALHLLPTDWPLVASEWPPFCFVPVFQWILIPTHWVTTLFCVSVPMDPYSSYLLITSDHWMTTLFCVCVPAEPYFSYPLTDQHVDIGSRLSWHCEARGKPPPTYTWYKDGQPLRNSSGDHWVWGLFCWAWVIKVGCCSVSQQNALGVTWCVQLCFEKCIP